MGDPRNTEICLSESGGNDVQHRAVAAATWVVSTTALCSLHMAGLWVISEMNWGLAVQKDL